MKRLICRLFGHRWDYRETHASGSVSDECNGCGEGKLTVTITADIDRFLEALRSIPPTRKAPPNE